MDEFQDQVVLVTGAGRGNGRAIAASFAARGAILAVNDLTPINLDDTVSQIQVSGGRARAYIFDVAKRMPVQAMVAQVLEDWGRIDILVNGAVVKPAGSLFAMDEWDWNRTLEVNLSSVFYAIQVVGRAMQSQGRGKIVNLGIPLHRGSAELQGGGAYLASKEGLRGLTRAASVELAADGIQVNAICLEQPGDGALLAPGEVAELVLHACSPAAAALTGQMFCYGASPLPC
jgi:NAD(P)-dependent dehydrogenase (short-subunit alcohol dehydrogenase family)